MTSIEWLIEQCPRILTIVSSDVLEQAKEMHKNEIINAWEAGEESEYQYHINSDYRSSSAQYYNSKY